MNYDNQYGFCGKVYIINNSTPLGPSIYKINPINVQDLESEGWGHYIRIEGYVETINDVQSYAMNDAINTYKLFTNLQEVKNFEYQKVIFNPPATIIIWKDGTKTIVKCQPDDKFDPEKGIALCFMKRALGNGGNFNNVFKKEIKKEVRSSINDLINNFSKDLERVNDGIRKFNKDLSDITGKLVKNSRSSELSKGGELK